MFEGVFDEVAIPAGGVESLVGDSGPHGKVVIESLDIFVDVLSVNIGDAVKGTAD